MLAKIIKKIRNIQQEKQEAKRIELINTVFETKLTGLAERRKAIIYLRRCI